MRSPLALAEVPAVPRARPVAWRPAALVRVVYGGGPFVPDGGRGNVASTTVAASIPINEAAALTTEPRGRWGALVAPDGAGERVPPVGGGGRVSPAADPAPPEVPAVLTDRVGAT